MATIQETLRTQLEAVAFKRTIPFCYTCYRPAPSGRCLACGSDDLMRLLEGHGVEYGVEWVLPVLLRENLSPVDTEEGFQEWMDELYPDSIEVCGILMDPVRILRALDEASWHQEYLGWLDSEVEDGRLVSFDHESTFYRVEDLEEWLDAQVADETPAGECAEVLS